VDLGGSKEPRASWEPGSLRGMGNHAMLSFGQISLTTYDLGLSRLICISDIIEFHGISQKLLVSWIPSI